jgi:hypothetical protein
MVIYSLKINKLWIFSREKESVNCVMGSTKLSNNNYVIERESSLFFSLNVF